MVSNEFDRYSLEDIFWNIMDLREMYALTASVLLSQEMGEQCLINVVKGP